MEGGICHLFQGAITASYERTMEKHKRPQLCLASVPVKIKTRDPENMKHSHHNISLSDISKTNICAFKQHDNVCLKVTIPEHITTIYKAGKQNMMNSTGCLTFMQKN